MLLLRIVTIFLTDFLLVSPCTIFPDYCKCYFAYTYGRYTGKCDGTHKSTKLDVIPKFPSKTTEVVFIHNNLYNVSRETLINVSSLPVTYLNLKYNNIRFIENDTFSDLIHLIRLDLSGNENISKPDVAKSFYSLPKSSIKELALNHMLWHPFKNMFDGLIGSRITKIELSHSYLTPFNGSWFSKLERLIKIDISWNSIQDNNYNFKGLSKLKWLNLAGNWFNIIPNFCRDGLHTLVSLFLTSTKLYTINHLEQYSRCLKKLEYINLSGLSLRILPNYIFAKLESLTALTINKMSTQLTKIRPFAFYSRSLKSLTFSRADGFRFSKVMAKKDSFEPRTLFKHCPNLTELDLSHNIIEFSSREIRNMFKPLKNLKSIWLESLYLAYMPKYFFYHFPLLEKISLENNMILPWTDGSIFSGLNNLQILRLKNNKISMIYPTSFPAKILDNLHSLDLMYNHFSCTCDLMWFRNWMKNTKVKIIEKNRYQCDSRKMRLVDYNPTPTECHILLITVSVGCGVGVILIATITVYFCRWRIRFQLYSIRSIRRKYEKLNNQDEFTYAAYIVYCYEDFKWVKNNLIPKIEVEQGFKLCILHRDFELGKVFADNIVEHMNLSKTVIPVLSNNFVRNEWCLFQLAVARNKLTKEGILSIFPIMLEEIEFKNMNAALYSLIKLSSYAAWDEDENALELFWDQIRDHLQSKT